MPTDGSASQLPMRRPHFIALACLSTTALCLAMALWSPWQQPAASSDEPVIDYSLIAGAAIETFRPLVEGRPAPEPEATPLGTFSMTYYWMASESRKGAREVQLYSKRRCRKVAKVSQQFANTLEMEGGGRMANGGVLIASGTCDCPTSPCFRRAPRGHTWGTGVNERPLSPFRSVAVDPSMVAIGTPLYVPELDGLSMPGQAPWGGFIHDGCVVADDRGGGVRGQQIDFFAAKRKHYKALYRRHKLKKVTVYDGTGRCDTHKAALASNRGSG